MQRMDNEIAALESKLVELLDDYRRLRRENRVLQDQVTKLDAENARLAAKVATAVERVESALAKLPTAEEL